MSSAAAASFGLDGALLPCAAAIVDRRGDVLRANALWPQELGGDWQSLAAADRNCLLAALAGTADFELRLPGGFLLRARWDAQQSAFVCLGQVRPEAEQLRLLADNVAVLLALYDANSWRCLFANQAYAQAFGLDVQTIVGQTFADVLGPAATQLTQPHIDRLLQQARPVHYERELQLPDGARRWAQVSLIPSLDVGGKVRTCLVQISDSTPPRLADLAVIESQARLEKFMQASMEGIVFHRDGVITDVNPPLCELLGYRLQELLGRNALDFVSPEERAKVAGVMNAGGELAYETVMLHRDGHRIEVELIVRDFECAGERLRMGIVRDIRERLAAQARIHYLAHHDGLTGLLNRSAFMEQVQELIAAAALEPRSLALLFIDLDNFKRVNDSLGHLEGDKVLKTVAERITDCLRASDLVARFGGDEFVILLDDVHEQNDVLVVLMALLAVVEVPVLADGCELTVTPSIGVAMYPAHGARAEDLIQHADMAMYLAKAKGRASYCFYEPSQADSAYAELVLESQLVQAIERNEFVLFFQPQVAAASGLLVGAEALLRWQHPQRGLIGPDAFIDVAERHRLMLDLGAWVMRAAALQARAWHVHGIAPVRIAVNLSRMEFRLDGFADFVAKLLSELEVPGEWLELELTERMLMDEIASAPATLAALRALGLTVSVDDFGTGYTSLSHLTRLPLDKLKIDQSFVSPLPADSGAAAIVRAVIQMASGLGLQVSAEGVRTAAQRDLLLEWGCDGLQGEMIGEPMSAQAFEHWLAQRKK